MPTTRRLEKWGTSLGLHIPRAVARETGLAAGDLVDVSVEAGAIVIRPLRPIYSLEELVAKITPRNRHGETNWDV